MEHEINQSLKKASQDVWGTSPAGWTFGENHKPGSKEFFDAVLKKRFSYETPWLDEIVQFDRFKNKNVLEIGSGAGYDAYQFCKAGAHYTGLDITPENPICTKQHLSYYGLEGRLIEGDVESMNFNQEFDFIYTFGVLHHTPDIKKSLNNCFSALKHGGEVQVIVYNKWSIFYCVTVVLFEWLLKCNWAKRSLKEQRSMIEYSESNARPLVNVYGKRALCRLLKQAGFKIKQTHIRKLVAEDLPCIRVVGRTYKYIPQKFLDFIGRYFGWYVSVRAVKE